MSSIIKCPHCHGEFDNEPLEEIVNPTLKIVRKSAERSSWNDIAEMIGSGQVYRLFDVGDSISCQLKNGKEILIDVAGFDLYGENQVVFCFHDLYGDSVMNDRNTNAGGFAESKMQRVLNNDIFKQLPDDLQAVIKPREIKQQIRGTEYGVKCNLWIPSIFEVRGAEYAECSSDVGDVWFPIFKDPRNRVKFVDGEDYSSYWWLRSPGIGNTTYFWLVNTNGYCSGNGASYSYGVCPCFII